MKTITLNFPDSADISEKEVSIMLAAQLYDKGKLSLGQAAELVGMNKAGFMDILGAYGISIFGESLEDIEKELGNNP